MIKLVVNLVLLAVSATTLQAQVVQGQVVDKDSQTPIHYAHVFSPETGEATVTDASGKFSLTLPPADLQRKIRVSFVGYKGVSVLVDPETDFYHFALVPDTTYLQEVDIRPPHPRKLLEEAIEKIPENHGYGRLTCFYRMVTKNGDKYIQVSEAAFAMTQRPQEETNVHVLRARETEDEFAFNGVGMGIGTKLSAVKHLDVVMDSRRILLSPSYLKNHNFFYEGVTRRGDFEVHEISFDQKKIRRALFTGKIWLHTGSLAIVGIEYSLSNYGMKYLKVGNAAERAALKLLNISIDLTAQKNSATYRPFGNKWYLSYAAKEESVRVKSKRYNFDVPVDDHAEFLVTAIDTTETYALQEQKLTEKDFIESAADTSSTFWEQYNIIPSSFRYEDVASVIEARNGFSSMKKIVEERLRRMPRDPASRADSLISLYHERGLFNGTALIKYKGKVILHKGYGLADKERNIKNDTTTIFRIGSVAKTFTARIIWQLEKEGKLSYADTVQRFLHWYPHEGVTIHHLLTHSSGIPNYTNSAGFLDSIDHPFATQQIVRRFGLERPAFTPGTDFQYSNTGYTLLALIAEEILGKSFQQIFSDRIAEPLGLHATTFGVQDDPRRAKGYWNSVIEPSYAIVNTAGAGGVASTTGDLLKWDESHTDPLLSNLFEPRTWYHDWGCYYGYGWSIDKYGFSSSKKHRIYYHAGTDLGFKTMFARQPDRGHLVVLLNNTGEFPLFDMTDLLFDILN